MNPLLWVRGIGLLAGLFAVWAVYHSITGAYKERDELRAEKKTLIATIEAAKRSVKASEDNTKSCEKDAQNVADLASRYIKDKQDVDIALADALNRSQRVRIVTQHTVGASPLPGQASTNTTGNNGACEGGLSRADKEIMEGNLSRLRDATYGLAAGADKIVLRLTRAQERIIYLESICRSE